MIVADTNVLSELLRPRPDPRVLLWADEADLAGIFVTSITEAEVFGGIGQLPRGRRRQELETGAERLFAEVFVGRILPFDSAAARQFADVTITRRAAGRPIDLPDAMIAAICAVHGAAIATRDEDGFDGLGIQVINPWLDHSK